MPRSGELLNTQSKEASPARGEAIRSGTKDTPWAHTRALTAVVAPARRAGLGVAEALGHRHDGEVLSEAPLEPVSAAGADACGRAREVATRARRVLDDADRAGRFDPAVVQHVRDAGLAGCCVPVELGGLGVTRLRDVMGVAFRLAEVDGSLAIVVHMHLGSTWSLARAWARSSGPLRQAVGTLLEGVAAGTVWCSAAVTERGTNYFHPAAELRAQEGGWRLDGEKVFATGSPAATHLTANVRIVGGPDHDRLATIVVPAATPGVTVVDDWDGLGMRASGSGQVRFEAVGLPVDTVVLPAGPFGELTPAALCGRAFGNVGNVAVMAGIAHAGVELARDRVRRGHRVGAALAGRPTVRHALAELEVDHLALSCVIDRLADIADRHASGPLPDPDGAHRFMADFQAAKLQVNRLAASVVDRALVLQGGAGYTAGHPLSRLARDVRAGPFMQPFSPHEALGFIGAVAAGTGIDVEA